MALRSREIEVNVEELDDVGLARRAAQGDVSSFEALYRRYEAAAWRVAQVTASTREDAADAVSEAFTNLLQALSSGKLNPEVPFLPYLLVATRNAAIDQHRKNARLQPLAPLLEDRPSTAAGPLEHAEVATDAGLVAEAFRSLPERWRSVLWMTEVEGIPARDVGPQMGLTPNGAAQLAHRARTGLRERFLQAHLRHRPRPECVETVGLLGAYAARNLPGRSITKVDRHLEGCAECRERLAELSDVGTTLRSIALPIPLLLPAAALAHYKLAFGIGGAAKAVGAVGTGTVVFGRVAGERVTRALAVTTSALLALGVITAGLMTGNNGATPVPSTRSGGAIAVAPGSSVTQFPSGTTSLIASTGAPTGGSGSFVDESPRVPRSELVAQSTAPAVTPPAKKVTPPKPPAPAPPVVGLQIGANLAVASSSLSLGVGGGCTGVSVNGSPSCAPKAPSAPGLSLSVTTPLGTIGTPAQSRRTA